MSSHTSRRTAVIFGLMPSAGALIDAVVSYAWPTIDISSKNIPREGLPAGLEPLPQTPVTLVDPSVAERVLAAAPSLLWAASLGLLLLIRPASLSAPIPTRQLAPGGTFALAGAAAWFYANHYFAAQPHHGDYETSSSWVLGGFVLIFLYRMITEAERAEKLTEEMNKVV